MKRRVFLGNSALATGGLFFGGNPYVSILRASEKISLLTAWTLLTMSL